MIESREFFAYDSNENSRDSHSATFQRLSTTIGRFFFGQSKPSEAGKLKKDRHGPSFTRVHHRTGTARPSLGAHPQFHNLPRSRNPRPSKIAGIALSIRAVRVPDCFALAK